MTDDTQYFAIVAEYRNIAILEKRGDKRAVWQGKEYFTDGHTYIGWSNDATGEHGAYRLQNEGDAKMLIDAFYDNGAILQEVVKGGHLLSYIEVYQYLYRKPFVGKVPEYAFNETEGVFVRVNGIRDGQHRHKGLK